MVVRLVQAGGGGGAQHGGFAEALRGLNGGARTVDEDEEHEGIVDGSEDRVVDLRPWHHAARMTVETRTSERRTPKPGRDNLRAQMRHESPWRTAPSCTPASTACSSCAPPPARQRGRASAYQHCHGTTAGLIVSSLRAQPSSDQLHCASARPDVPGPLCRGFRSRPARDYMYPASAPPRQQAQQQPGPTCLRPAGCGLRGLESAAAGCAAACVLPAGTPGTAVPGTSW